MTNLLFAQDIITFKNGDEIKSKVIEVTPDLIKYKKWENQDGPIYSSNKSEVFMVKYANGTKDVFKDNPAAITYSTQTGKVNNGSKFIGTWYHKKYDGSSNKTILSISRAGEDYLVNLLVHVRVDGIFYDADGSFKEVGHMEGNSIVISSLKKLSLLDDNTILMSNDEYYRYPMNNQPSNITSNTATTITGTNSETVIKKESDNNCSYEYDKLDGFTKKRLVLTKSQNIFEVKIDKGTSTFLHVFGCNTGGVNGLLFNRGLMTTYKLKDDLSPMEAALQFDEVDLFLENDEVISLNQKEPSTFAKNGSVLTSFKTFTIIDSIQWNKLKSSPLKTIRFLLKSKQLGDQKIDKTRANAVIKAVNCIDLRMNSK